MHRRGCTSGMAAALPWLRSDLPRRTNPMGRAGRNLVFLHFGEFNTSPPQAIIKLLFCELKYLHFIQKPFLQKRKKKRECCISDRHLFATKSEKDDVKLERGRTAPLILQISTKSEIDLMKSTVHGVGAKHT